MSKYTEKNACVELFAGVGGFRVGLNDVKLENGAVNETSNWEFVYVNQWEPSTKTQDAFQCYEKRFGSSPNHTNIDIAKVEASEIPEHKLLVGGFPCQDYSVARSLKNEKGIEGKKGVLWWEIHRIIKEKNTPFLLLENVDRLLKAPSKQRGKDFGIILYALNELNYSVEWRVINAGEVGFPQRRRRVFLFAYKNDTNYGIEKSSENTNTIILETGIFAKTFPIKLDEKKKIETEYNFDDFSNLLDVSETFAFEFQNSGLMRNGIISTKRTKIKNITFIPLKDILLEDSKVSKSLILTDEQIEKFKHLRGGKKIERTAPDGSKYFYSEGSMSEHDDINLSGRTMLTSESSINRSTHLIKYNNTYRFIDPVEAERMNCFPDDWTNTGMTYKRRYFMMGNALVTGIISKLSLYLNKIN